MNNNSSEIFNQEELLNLLDEISVKEQQMKDAIEHEENMAMAHKSMSSKEETEEDTKAWMNNLLAELESKPDAEEKAFVPRDISDYSKEIYSDAQLLELEKGIEHRVDIDIYSDPKFSHRQMKQIRYGLERGLDVTYYANIYFRENQMIEIRRGLQDHLDVAGYARILYSASDMKEKREKLFHEKYDESIEELSYDFDDRETGLHIYVEPGLMEAGIVINRQLPSTFTKKELLKLMKSYDITYGFDENSLPNNLSNLPKGVKIPVMQGKKPVIGKDGLYKFVFEISENTKPTIREDGSVQYFSQKNYHTVKTGDTVANYVPATLGENGISVTNMSVQGYTGKEPQLIDSEDLVLSDDKKSYIVKRDGVLCVTDGKVTIIDILEYDHDITYMDGPIVFDGDIKIKGSVTDNISITSSGDIVITGYVGGANIVSGKDIVIIGGVNGDEEASIIAKGKIAAGFFENAHVEAGGDIETGYALNSDIICEGTFTTKGRKSLICGGAVIARKGVNVDTIGSKSRTKTYVEAGSSDDDMDEYMELARKRDDCDKQIQKINSVTEAMIIKLGAVEARQNESYLKLQDTLEETKEKKINIQNSLDLIENKRIEKMSINIKVGRDVYENTTISINGNNMLLKEDRKSSVFSCQGRSIVVS